MAETADPAAQMPQAPETPEGGQRGADWTLVQLSGRLHLTHFEGRPMEKWGGQWVATNQRGDVYLYGEWGDCWRSAVHWARFGPPKGAAEGEDGTGWRGPVPGLEP